MVCSKRNLWWLQSCGCVDFPHYTLYVMQNVVWKITTFKLNLWNMLIWCCWAVRISLAEKINSTSCNNKNICRTLEYHCASLAFMFCYYCHFLKDKTDGDFCESKKSILLKYLSQSALTFHIAKRLTIALGVGLIFFLSFPPPFMQVNIVESILFHCKNWIYID